MPTNGGCQSRPARILRWERLQGREASPLPLVSGEKKVKRLLCFPVSLLIACWFAFLSGVMLLAFWLDEWWAEEREDS